jgi:dephospho-CoA kinase
VILVGLTGGIGSGKSTVSNLLRERHCVIIDGDQIARNLQVPHGPAIAPLAKRFPNAVRDGILDRQALAEIVFVDPEELAALNAIMLPLINEGIMREIEANRQSSAIVVLDMPLLAEYPRRDLSGVIVVDIDPELATERLVTMRGMMREDVLARMSKQASRERRLAIADRVITNDSTLDDLIVQVDYALAWASTLPAAGPRAGEPVSS